ncbi:MAG: RNA polymerase sigma factor [Eubacteriales bacterium]
MDNKQTELISLYDLHKNTVFRLALSYLRNEKDAEDVVQEVFLKLIEKEKQGKITLEAGKEKALLTKITVNHCRDILRSFWKTHTTDLENIVEPMTEDSSTLLKNVMELPTKQRVTIYLHYYEGYTFEEIGKFLKISPSAVSMRIHRGRKMLKADLEEVIL